MRASSPLLLAGALTALCACSPGPAPSLYFLDTSLSPRPHSVEAPIIGLAEVTLPAYARKPQIANRTDDHRVVLDDDHRWAVPPTEAVSSALAKTLEAQLGGPVVLRPYPRGFTPDIQVRVTFDRFLRNADGAAELAGQYIVFGGPSDEPMQIRRFQITGTVEGDGYDAFMRSVTDALQELAIHIANDSNAA